MQKLAHKLNIESNYGKIIATPFIIIIIIIYLFKLV